MSIPERFMQMALDLARRGLGRTAPNPPVGAVLVRDGEVVGTGFHPAAGQPHAEIFALREAGDQARGADLYVTLEPCSHQGRTGPCTEALIAAGIRRVMVGTTDPNPRVAGSGIVRLRAAGIEVVTGPLEPECRRLIAPFACHILSGRPFVIFKTAMTLDGGTATSTGESRWISGEASRERVHRLRDQVDGILVGAGTIAADNPRLTTRLPQGGRDPVRIVVDGRLQTSADAAVYSGPSSAPAWLITSTEHSPEALTSYRDRKVDVIAVEGVDGRLDLPAAMQELGRRNLQTVLLEGGSNLAGEMLRAGLIDRVMIFIAPLLLAGEGGRGLFAGPGVERLAEAMKLTGLRVTPSGEDILVEGEVEKCLPA